MLKYLQVETLKSIFNKYNTPVFKLDMKTSLGKIIDCNSTRISKLLNLEDRTVLSFSEIRNLALYFDLAESDMMELLMLSSDAKDFIHGVQEGQSVGQIQLIYCLSKSKNISDATILKMTQLLYDELLLSPDKSKSVGTRNKGK